MCSTGSGPSETSRVLLDSPDFWRALADSVPALFLVVDREGSVLYVNRTPDGGPVGPSADHAALDFVPAESRRELASSLRRIFEGAPPHSREERRIAPDGTGRWSAIHVWDVTLKAQVVAAVVIARDVTEQRRLFDGARDWQRLDSFGQISAGVVHDFNNMLALISASAQLIADATPTDSATRGDVDTILAEARRGLALTRQLLAFARRKPPTAGETDLNVVVRDVAAVLRNVVHGSIEIVESLDPAGALVRVDRSQLEQVVMNLVLNARDATEAGGTISLMTTRVGAGIRLLVTDTGNGMSDETRAHLFEPFFTTREEAGGTGLGLWTVDAIVRRAGGTVDVYSAPGAGTTFVVTLPPDDGT
jgi:two-component system, cell cycle sensor histidine kinase and response regulator CckA